MSNYPIWWDSDITIYNKHMDSTTNVITWYRKTLSGCFWKYVRDKARLGNTTLETESTICRIPENSNYMEKHLWDEFMDAVLLPDNNTYPLDELFPGGSELYFTLGRGDIIIKGAVTDNIDEYTAGQRSTDLIAKYKELQGCIEVDSVAIDTGLGRCLPHYRVQGV